jgi:hypothetical protein
MMDWWAVIVVQAGRGSKEVVSGQWSVVIQVWVSQGWEGSLLPLRLSGIQREAGKLPFLTSRHSDSSRDS